VKVSIIIPVFNEAATIGEVLARVDALDLDKQLIIVDDGSTDATPAIIDGWQAEHDDTLVLPQVVEPIIRGVADVVFGSRLSGGRPQRAYLFSHLVANRFLSLLTNVLFNTTLTDIETGYKAFRADVLRSLDLRSDDFAIEPEIAAKVCKRHLRLYELPISYYGRTYDEGKKITWRDGVKAVVTLLRVRVAG
jgi:glycosyltransferase involved in cell wall biosynthesis